MKSILIALFAVVASSQVWASSVDKKLGGMLVGAIGKSPNEILKDFYDHAVPMTLNQFLLPNDPTIKKWDCVGTTKDTTFAQLAPIGSVPVHYRFNMLVTPPTPATPPAGPLFPGPGTPGSPGTYSKVDAVSWVSTSDNTVVSDSRLADWFTGYHVHISISPGVVETQDTSYDPGSTITTTFRIMNGLPVMHVVASSPSTAKILAEYGYCFPH